MYAQAVRIPPRLRHRGGRRILSSASEQCAKGCAFPDVQLDCIKYLKLGDVADWNGHVLTGISQVSNFISQLVPQLWMSGQHTV